MRLKSVATQGNAVLGGEDKDEEIVSNFLMKSEAYLVESRERQKNPQMLLKMRRKTEHLWQKFVNWLAV